MRIARIATTGARVALVERDELRLLPEKADILDLLRDPDRAKPTTETLPLGAAALLPPLDPPSIRDFLTFEQHVEGMVRLHQPPREVHPRWYEAPSSTSRTPTPSSVRTTTSQSRPAASSSTTSSKSPR